MPASLAHIAHPPCQPSDAVLTFTPSSSCLGSCTLEELESGLCCGSGCGIDNARVWTADDCAEPAEFTPIIALPAAPSWVRVSINGQQFSANPPLFHQAPEPLRAEPGFTYYDESQLVFSAILPSRGPVAGGTEITLLGMGFVDFGAKVGFSGIGFATNSSGSGRNDSSTVLVPAVISLGLLRGRMVTCRTPPALLAGPVAVELALNGVGHPPDRTSHSGLRFQYLDDQVAEGASGDAGQLESGSGL